MATVTDPTGNSVNCDGGDDNGNCDGGDDNDDSYDDTKYDEEMKMLTASLSVNMEKSNDQICELKKTRDTLKAEISGISEKVAEVMNNIKNMNSLSHIVRNMLSMIEDYVSENEEICGEVRMLKNSEYNEQLRLRVNADTRAQMLGTQLPTETQVYTSAKIVKYHEEINALTNTLRNNEADIKKMRKHIAKMKTDIANRPALISQKKSLIDQRSILGTRLEGITDRISKTSRLYTRLDKCLIMAEMLSDYEEYLSTNYDITPQTLWHTVKSNRGEFHDNWSKSAHTYDTDSELEYFEEYLYTIVGTCNRHRYEYLKDTYVATCLCYNMEWDTSDHDYYSYSDGEEGFHPNCNRCSHGAKMQWVDDDDWAGPWSLSRKTQFSDGVMFSLPHSREMDFTIHSDIPPGHVESS